MNIYGKIRTRYGISKRMMSRLLGFGVNQWRLYEEGSSTPKDTHAIMINVVKDPRMFRKLFTDNERFMRLELGDTMYERLVGKVDDVLKDYKYKTDKWYQDWVNSLYQ